MRNDYGLVCFINNILILIYLSIWSFINQIVIL